MDDIPLLSTLILLSAFFSGLEIALFSLSEAKLRSLSEGDVRSAKQAKRVLRIKENPQKLLVTILIGNNLVNISAASLATAVAINVFDSNGIGIATGAMTLIILIFGEIIPKSIAQQHPDAVARWTSPITLFLLYALTPVSYILEILARLANLLTGGKGDMDKVSEEEVKAMVYMGSEAGTVEADEREMIENIFTLNDVTAEDAMTQVTDVVGLNLSQQPKEILRIMTGTGY